MSEHWLFIAIGLTVSAAIMAVGLRDMPIAPVGWLGRLWRLLKPYRDRMARKYHEKT